MISEVHLFISQLCGPLHWNCFEAEIPMNSSVPFFSTTSIKSPRTPAHCSQVKVTLWLLLPVICFSGNRKLLSFLLEPNAWHGHGWCWFSEVIQACCYLTMSVRQYQQIARYLLVLFAYEWQNYQLTVVQTIKTIISHYKLSLMVCSSKVVEWGLNPVDWFRQSKMFSRI